MLSLMELKILGDFLSWEAAIYSQPETLFQTEAFLRSEMALLNSTFVQHGEESSLLAWIG